MNIPAYSREELHTWQTGPEWRRRALHWLEELVVKYGKEQFRLRKGPAKDNVKVICEELLPLANFLIGAVDLSEPQARLSLPGDKADAWIRSPIESREIPIQIVCGFDGRKFAEQMKSLNARGFTRTEAASLTEIVAVQSALTSKAIEKKHAKGYPAGYSNAY